MPVNSKTFIREEKGAAVLDWPFCAIGGNGVGRELCSYYTRDNHIYAYSRFHGKKVMGEYFGRLTLSQIEPYLDAGWGKLFTPDVPDIMKAAHQTRCFTNKEWRFFEGFFTLNDFAGINLYTDLLPLECLDGFYRRFGRPVAQTDVPGAGPVQFIPKPDTLKDKQNVKEGLSVSLISSLKPGPYNLLDENQSENFVLYGLGREGKDKHLHGIFPLSRISFRLSGHGIVHLSVKGINKFSGQTITININGSDVAEIRELRSLGLFEKDVTFQGRQGINVITFVYRKQPRFYDLLLQDVRRLLDSSYYREILAMAKQGIGDVVSYEAVKISLSSHIQR